jgi:hypothetical protein
MRKRRNSPPLVEPVMRTLYGGAMGSLFLPPETASARTPASARPPLAASRPGNLAPPVAAAKGLNGAWSTRAGARSGMWAATRAGIAWRQFEGARTRVQRGPVDAEVNRMVSFELWRAGSPTCCVV